MGPENKQPSSSILWKEIFGGNYVFSHSPTTSPHVLENKQYFCALVLVLCLDAGTQQPILQSFLYVWYLSHSFLNLLIDFNDAEFLSKALWHVQLKKAPYKS